MAPSALKGTSPKSAMMIFHYYPTVSFWIWGRQEGAAEIEKNLISRSPAGMIWSVRRGCGRVPTRAEGPRQGAAMSGGRCSRTWSGAGC